MREINIPVSQTAQMSIAGDELRKLLMEGGSVPFGTVDFAASAKALNMARKNGGHIVYGAIEVSQKLEDVIANYLFGKDTRPPPEKSFFRNEILGTPNITFQFKKELFKKIVNLEELLTGKDKHDFYKALDDISTWRNAFAHGSLAYDAKGFVLLKYYSNKSKSIELNEQYWNLVESTFKFALQELDKMTN
jgi:hypothetical protein